jgi:hypothetical protein
MSEETTTRSEALTTRLLDSLGLEKKYVRVVPSELATRLSVEIEGSTFPRSTSLINDAETPARAASDRML